MSAYLPDNTIFLSKRGKLNTLLAGGWFWSSRILSCCLSWFDMCLLVVRVCTGDLDGDLNQVCFCPPLVAFVRATEAAVAAQDWEAGDTLGASVAPL